MYLGVEGAMSGSEDMKPQSKEVTPSKQAQTIMPDEEYNCLSQVTVKAIPAPETDNFCRREERHDLDSRFCQMAANKVDFWAIKF